VGESEDRSSANAGHGRGLGLVAAALNRDPGADDRPLARNRRHLHLSLDKPDALAHAEQPEAIGCRTRIESAPIVAHLDSTWLSSSASTTSIHTVEASACFATLVDELVGLATALQRDHAEWPGDRRRAE
jgi:hypothetical protein